MSRVELVEKINKMSDSQIKRLLFYVDLTEAFDDVKNFTSNTNVSPIADMDNIRNNRLNDDPILDAKHEYLDYLDERYAK